MRPVDLIVCGSVTVDLRGVRIGKGAGYSDNEPIPAAPHDFRVDYIVTPTQVIRCPPSPPPAGIDWERVAPEQVAAIPVLSQRRPS
jgi:5-formyltetrahydrofolate cyclo-ligase